MIETQSRVLIIDDNPQDAELVALALRKCQPGVMVLFARDWEEATAVLPERSAEAAPRLILLDLKLPKVDGFELLRRLKGDPTTRSIPVVVLTSSNLERDVQLAYSLGANSYVVKPMEFDELNDTMGRLGDYWLTIDRGPAFGGA